MKKQKNSPSPKPEVLRPVDLLFKDLQHSFPEPARYPLYISCLLLFYFGIMGLIWMIPFPQFDFLVQMKAHTFLNWGSFFIAIIIYCYLKLAPSLSYAVLFTIGIFSFFIVRLEYVERDGGPAVWLVSAILAIVGLLGLFAVANKEAKAPTMTQLWKLIAVGPIWFWSKLFARFNWKY